MEKTILEIKMELESAGEEEREQLIKEYAADERSGVIKLIQQYEKKAEWMKQELKRLEMMRAYEKNYEKKYSFICGIDEVGRGPLAGPVVAGAVILPKNCTILYLNDSKQLSEKRRELLYNEIVEKAVAFGIGLVTPKRIDEINILQATYEAMRMAIHSLSVTPDLLLNDAVFIPDVSIPQISIIKGDEKSLSIAAASVIAKVTRDRIMVDYEKVYPGYGFAKNKGYGSEEHIEALKNLGKTKIHRASFLKNILTGGEKDGEGESMEKNI